MATKTSKKVPAKVAPKKVVKQLKTPKKSTAKFISFSVRAVIPVQSYSNIQPEITVQAATYEEAREFTMPLIEALFRQYSESKPAFLGKITETQKVVGMVVGNIPARLAEAQNVPAPVAAAPATYSGAVVAPQAPAAPVEASALPKSPAVEKAEKMIGLAMSADAAIAIQDQIEKSVKLLPEEKPALIRFVLQKRNTFK